MAKNLDVVHLGQLDNRLNPYGSCNVTSIAMCLHFLGIRGNGVGQLEDQLNTEIKKRGWSRHSHAHLAKLVNEVYGVKVSPNITDRFSTTATIEEIKAHIDKGFPCVISGYFTSSGHIIVVRGYNDDGFVVNDPYGEWFPNGYQTGNRNGEGLTYSYGMIKRLCTDNGRDGIWCHFIER